ncbi:hypothetical protein BIW11_08497 [Tropilaelaps mercedesae]|uniref:Uncharacterized protein n=1 Tax=Tropilaelaps mercedesae TaxID=418985 RepID=A0A1V9XP92_9ACAR|nr:hypothetical protein BIW11_08497 [Tropilaelaps mercedesae]
MVFLVIVCTISALLSVSSAVPFKCPKFYCISEGPCGVPLPDCAAGRQPANFEWLRMHVDGKHVIGMAPSVYAGFDYVLEFGQQCSLVIRVQRPDEDIPMEVCIAANNVNDDFFNNTDC